LIIHLEFHLLLRSSLTVDLCRYLLLRRRNSTTIHQAISFLTHHRRLTHELIEDGTESESKREKKTQPATTLSPKSLFNGEFKSINHHQMQSRFLSKCQSLLNELAESLPKVLPHACNVTLHSRGFCRSTCRVRNVFAHMPPWLFLLFFVLNHGWSPRRLSPFRASKLVTLVSTKQECFHYSILAHSWAPQLNTM